MTGQGIEKGARVLMVMAHPDDEVIFGWPILQREDLQVRVLCCVSDIENPVRKKREDRYGALIELSQMLKFEVECLHFRSCFFSANDKPVMHNRTICEVLMMSEARFWPDYVFTHNPIGEYGHLDHIMVHQSVLQSTGKPVLYTDMYEPGQGWVPWDRLSRPVPGDVVVHTALKEKWYGQCEAVYRRHRAWTWNKPPITKARVLKWQEEA